MILTGNTIVVTGGGTGIGRGLAEAFKARGNELIVAGQSRFLERDAAATPGMAHLALDQDDPASVLKFAEALARDHPETNVQVIEIVPPMTQTALQGDQGFNPAAMTLRDLIAEGMALLEAEPQADEIVPDRAKALRFAERSGFEAQFQQYNAASTRR